MKCYLWVLVVLGSMFPVFGNDLSKEPALGLTLMIDGKPHALEMGVEKKLNGTFYNPTVQLHAAKSRTFSYGGITLEYPSYFTWEADVSDPSVLNWNMSGNTCVIMYMVFDQAITLDAMIQGMIQQYGAENSQTSPISHQLGSLKLSGQRIKATIGDNSIHQDMLVVPSPAGTFRLLILQDIDPTIDPSLEEAKMTMAFLSQSFKVLNSK